MKFVCSICKWEYDTFEKAVECEAQGVRGNTISVGIRFKTGFNGGTEYEVIELLPASHMDHMPGVRTSIVVKGVKTKIEAIFDEETITKYLD